MRNVLVLRLETPAWRQEQTTAPVQRTPREIMEDWSVDAVVDFYRSRDAAGIATRMQDNSVAGADLVQFGDAEALQADLRMTPFAARKALRLRDSYLH